MTVLYVILGFVAFIFLLDAWNRHKIRQARESGLYPPKGAGSIADVERLVRNGHKILAIKLYREIYDVDLKTAHEAVKKIAKDLSSPPVR